MTRYSNLTRPRTVDRIRQLAKEREEFSKLPRLALSCSGPISYVSIKSDARLSLPRDFFQVIHSSCFGLFEKIFIVQRVQPSAGPQLSEVR